MTVTREQPSPTSKPATDGAAQKEGTDVAILTQSEAAIPSARRSVEVGGVPAQSDAAPSAEASPDGSAASGNSVTSVTMIEPMAGFDHDLEFSLSPIDEAGMLQSLRSLRDPELRFVLSPAEVFFANYRDSLTPVIAHPVADALGVEVDDAELTMFVMLTIGTSLTDTTANLRAPVVVDAVTGRAIQVILDDDALPLRQPLPTE